MINKTTTVYRKIQHICLFFFLSLNAHSFFISDLEQTSIQPIKEWLMKNNQPCTIYVTPANFLLSWSDWYTQKIKPYTHYSTYIKLITGSVGILSYIGVFYSIYRAYNIIIKIKKIIALFSTDDEESIELYVRNSSLPLNHLLYTYKQPLLHYYYIHTLLEKMHIRMLFPYDEKLHHVIIKYCNNIKK